MPIYTIKTGICQLAYFETLPVESFFVLRCQETHIRNDSSLLFFFFSLHPVESHHQWSGHYNPDLAISSLSIYLTETT